MTHKLLVYGWTPHDNPAIPETPPYTAVHEFATAEAAGKAAQFFERGNLITQLVEDAPPPAVQLAHIQTVFKRVDTYLHGSLACSGAFEELWGTLRAAVRGELP